MRVSTSIYWPVAFSTCLNRGIPIHTLHSQWNVPQPIRPKPAAEQRYPENGPLNLVGCGPFKISSLRNVRYANLLICLTLLVGYMATYVGSFRPRPPLINKLRRSMIYGAFYLQCLARISLEKDLCELASPGWYVYISTSAAQASEW